MKIVCIRDGFGFHKGETVPLVGPVYSIRELRPSREFPGELVFRLQEIHNEPCHYHVGGFTECWFRSSRFRPLTENKTSISFTEGAPKDSERFDNRRKVRVRA